MASTPLADRAYSVLNNAFASHASLAALDSGSLRIQCLSCGRAATDGDCDCDSSESSDDDDERATTCSSSAPFRLIAVSLEAHRSSAPPQPQRVRIVHADLGLCLGVSKCRRRVELQPLVTEDEGYAFGVSVFGPTFMPSDHDRVG